MDTYEMPRVGQSAPVFTARSTGGVVNFPSDFSGRWVLLYIYIGDFQPCCTSDILALNTAAPRLKSYNAEVIAVSPDSVPTHIAWALSLRNLNNGSDLTIDLASDQMLDIARSYGVNNVGDDVGKIEKAVVLIDQSGTIQAMHKLPYATGINVTELERELLAIQSARYQFGITPSGWTPGEDLMEYPPQTVSTAGSNVSERTASGSRCVDWYLCYRQDSGLRKPSPTSQIEAQRQPSQSTAQPQQTEPPKAQ